MAEEADDRCVRDQLKVLTGLKLPGFNWNANNMRMEFDNLLADSYIRARGHGHPKGQVVPLNSTTTWQRGDGMMDYKHRSHSQPKRPLAIIKAFKKG